jgi:hypothetical protein
LGRRIPKKIHKKVSVFVGTLKYMRFQFVAAFVYVSTIFGFLGLYATLMCVACSQLEKLRASLLDIRQKHDTAEQNSGAEADQEEEEEEVVYTPQEVFRHMQKQLNDCVRHHQEILRCLLFLLFIFTNFLLLSSFDDTLSMIEILKRRLINGRMSKH